MAERFEYAVMVRSARPNMDGSTTGYDCTCRSTPGCPNYDPSTEELTR